MEVWIRPRCAIGHERVHMQLVLDSQVHVLREGQLHLPGPGFKRKGSDSDAFYCPIYASGDHAPINSFFLASPWLGVNRSVEAPLKLRASRLGHLMKVSLLLRVFDM